MTDQSGGIPDPAMPDPAIPGFAGPGAAGPGGAGPTDPADMIPEVGCAEVMAEVWTLLDGECTPETQAKLRHHLEKCPRCLRHYGVEERIKALVGRKGGGEKAPPRLLERVRVEIRRTTIIHW